MLWTAALLDQAECNIPTCPFQNGISEALKPGYTAFALRTLQSQTPHNTLATAMALCHNTAEKLAILS